MFAQLAFVVLLRMTAALGPPVMFGRPRGGFLKPPQGEVLTDSNTVVYSNITQIVDHIGNITGTWTQRYQYNPKFYNDTTGIVFLMIGGEGSISPPGDKWVRDESIMMMQWAKRHGAAAFHLEHRFYGPPGYAPLNKQDTEALKLLTIDQALEDIKEFMKQMNEKYFKGTNTKWVTFGGSYPGSLSAFFRETYPELTIGAVSTSSAVNVFVDYYGYLQNAEENYREQNASCAASIATAFRDMQTNFYNGTGGRQQLKKVFRLCDDFDEKNLKKAMQFFFSNVIGYFQGINQYSGDNRNNATRNGLGIPMACDIMMNTTVGGEMSRVQNVIDWYSQMSDGAVPKCYPNSYADYIKHYSDVSYKDTTDVVAMRSWVWQTCTELGYFQTTDSGNKGIFGSTLPVDFFSDQCTELFGKQYTLDETYRRVEAVHQRYGGADAYKISDGLVELFVNICPIAHKKRIEVYLQQGNTSATYSIDRYYHTRPAFELMISLIQGSKAVFPNGSLDPWKSLGLLNSNDDMRVDAFMIDGTAHCADMYPETANDRQSLKDGRARILKNLDSWILEALTPKRSTSSSGFLITSLLALIWSLYM